MKNIYNLIAALIFSTIFYQQSIGLNLLLFTILTTCILLLTHFKSFKSKQTLFISCCYLATGIAVFFHYSTLVLIANLISFVTLIGSISEEKNSIYIKWLNGIYTTIVAYFANYFENENTQTSNSINRKLVIIHWLKIVIPSIIIIVLFISLYKQGNPMFNKLITNIDLSFINFQWILLTILGYYLFNNITNPIKIEPATEIDLKTGNSLNYISPKKAVKTVNEIQLGTTLLILLNGLIILYLVTDFVFLFKINQLNAVELSQQVHSGVYSLIVSIVLAIGIILYFFRGSLNFNSKNKNLKKLTYLWLFLNLVVSIITAIKNLEYINSFGLTYKRVGVLIYLTLTIIGLTTAYIKVSKIKNFWYLIRKNTQIAFIILILFSTLNWDKIITNFNISYAQQTDVDYLLNLTDNNTLLLHSYAEKSPKINNYYKEKINDKYVNYVNKLKNNTWKEIVYDNFKIN